MGVEERGMKTEREGREENEETERNGRKETEKPAERLNVIKETNGKIGTPEGPENRWLHPRRREIRRRCFYTLSHSARRIIARARARACTHARVLDRAAAAPVSDGWVDGRNGGCVRSERVGCTSSVHSPLDEGKNASLDESQRREREGGGGDFSLLFDELILTIWFFGFFGLLFSLSLFFFLLLLEGHRYASRSAGMFEFMNEFISRIQKSGTIALHDPRSVCAACNRYNLGISTESQFRHSFACSFLLNICRFFCDLFSSLTFFFSLSLVSRAFPLCASFYPLSSSARSQTRGLPRTIVNRIVGCSLYAPTAATITTTCVQSHTRERPRAAVDRNKIRNRNNGCVSWMCTYYRVTIYSQSCSIGVSRRRGVVFPTSGRVPLSKGPPFTRVRRPRAPMPPAIISIQK